MYNQTQVHQTIVIRFYHVVSYEPANIGELFAEVPKLVKL